MRELPVTLAGSTCIVLGFGRIAKALTRLLCAFGAKVLVAARSHSDLAWARIFGAEPLYIAELSEYLEDAELLVNTVPAMLLDAEKLSKLGPDCLVIDLASKPGGVDFEVAGKLGVKTIWALSLPGKASPVTAGEITLNTIFNVLGERGKL